MLKHTLNIAIALMTSLALLDQGRAFQENNTKPDVQRSTMEGFVEAFMERKEMKIDKNGKVETFIPFYDQYTCELNANKVFLFGDNLIRRGKAGQAIIRDNENALGFATKLMPGMADSHFFTDTSFDEIAGELIRVANYLMQEEREILVVPINFIGTGLAEFDKRAPLMFLAVEVFFYMLGEYEDYTVFKFYRDYSDTGTVVFTNN